MSLGLARGGVRIGGDGEERRVEALQRSTFGFHLLN